MVSLRPGDRLGPYLLERRIALGGMAEIWAAHDDSPTGEVRRYALKVLLPALAKDAKLRTMFLDEAKIAERLRHPNIVHLVGSGDDGGWHYQSMQLVDGRDLRRILSAVYTARARVPIPLAIMIAGEVARGLGYAHNAKSAEGKPLDVVHRDVSPHNVMVARDGAVKILDFGIAAAKERATKTAQGVIKGKVAYMSPEQALAQPVTAKSDIYSLGIVLWEMLSMRRLYKGTSDVAVLRAVCESNVPPIAAINPAVPEALAELVSKMLALKPRDRPESMRDVENGLSRVLYARYPEAEGSREALASWVRAFIDPGKKATAVLKVTAVETVAEDGPPAAWDAEAVFDDQDTELDPYGPTAKKAASVPPASPVADPTGPTSLQIGRAPTAVARAIDVLGAVTADKGETKPPPTVLLPASVLAPRPDSAAIEPPPEPPKPVRSRAWMAYTAIALLAAAALAMFFRP